MDSQPNPLQSNPKSQHYFEVEEIIDYRISEDGRNLYKVQWAGYPAGCDTWEPMENLHKVRNKVEKFQRRRRLQNRHKMAEDSVDKNILGSQIKSSPKQTQQIRNNSKKKQIKKSLSKELQKIVLKVEKNKIYKEGKSSKTELKNYFQVNKILDKKYHQNKLYYKVRWEGFTEKDDTWQSASSLVHLKGMIQQYEEQHNDEEKKPKVKKMKPKKQEKVYYEIEKILDKKMGLHGALYRVRWKGYSQAYDTWQPYRNLVRARVMIKKFNKRDLPNKQEKVQQQKAEEMVDQNINTQESRMQSVFKQTDQMEMIEDSHNGANNYFEEQEDNENVSEISPVHINQKQLYL